MALELTFPYKDVDGQTSHVDIFLPSNTPAAKPLHTILYFHGGGLTVGSRKSYFPRWIHDYSLKAGYAFMSADYRLIPPSTAHDILDDIQDLFRFLDKDVNRLLINSKKTDYQIDASSVFVSGSSAGGLCAYLAALHAFPKPKGVLSLYAMGGDFLTPQYLTVKTKPFFIGREMLDPVDFKDFLQPFTPDLLPTSDSPLAYHPLDDTDKPGWPKNLRMQLCRLYLQLGIFLDYFTGEHTSSLSMQLRAILMSENKDPNTIVAVARFIIPEKHIRLFPQFLVDSTFPPTFLLHGKEDSAVHVQESYNMKNILDGAGVEAVLRVVDGEEHSFDYAQGADKKHEALFDEAFVFIRKVFDGI